MKIDAVITWVDGNDPAHKRKMAEYGNRTIFSQEDVASSARYVQVGEIFWCVASINKFAPWINRIYIVTDGQDPHLIPFLERHFPDGYIPVQVIDHREIFSGYEEFLPVFNSVSIETMTWRIAGLSEHYIEFNDDFMLAKEVKPEDFFDKQGNPVIYADKYPTFLARLTRALKRKKSDGKKKVTFKGLLLGALDYTGGSPFFLHYKHTPRPLRRSFFEDFFGKNPDALTRNIQFRFRDPSQFNPEEVQYLSLFKEGKCTRRPAGKNLYFIQLRGSSEHVDKKIDALTEVDVPFCCFNSLDSVNPGQRKRMISWMEDRIGIHDTAAENIAED